MMALTAFACPSPSWASSPWRGRSQLQSYPCGRSCSLTLARRRQLSLPCHQIRGAVAGSNARRDGRELPFPGEESFVGDCSGLHRGVAKPVVSRRGKICKCIAVNLGPAEASPGPAGDFKSRMAQEASTASIRVYAARHYENVLAMLAVSGEASTDQVSGALLPVAEKEIREKGLQNRADAPFVNFETYSQDDVPWLTTFTRFKVPVHHFFDAAPRLQAAKASGYVKMLRRQYDVPSNDSGFEDEDVQEMGAKYLARDVKVDSINSIAVGFRPPGQWERDQLGANFTLWHTPYFTSGSVFLEGSRGFLNLLCRSLAAFCFWEEIPQSAKDGLEEVDEAQKEKGGFLSRLKSLPQALMPPSPQNKNPVSSPGAWIPSPTAPVRFRTISPSVSRYALEAAAEPIEKGTKELSKPEAAERVAQLVLAGKREVREWWPVPAAALEEIVALKASVQKEVDAEKLSGMAETFSGQSSKSDPGRGEASGQYEERVDRGGGQAKGGREYSEARKGAPGGGFFGRVLDSMDSKRETVLNEDGASSRTDREETMNGNRAAESEGATTSGREATDHRRMGLVDPQDFQMHLMQVEGFLLDNVRGQKVKQCWRIDKDGNRSTFKNGITKIEEDDVVELLLTHSQLVDLAEALDSFMNDKNTWLAGDRPMLVKIPVRPADVPVKVEKTWLSDLPRLVLRTALALAFTAALRTPAPQRPKFPTQAVSAAQQQIVEPRTLAPRRPSRKVVLPANSAVPEDEMQLLCDAVATMAGFWTPARSSNEGATELVFQLSGSCLTTISSKRHVGRADPTSKPWSLVEHSCLGTLLQVVMSRDGEVLGCRPENSAAVEQWSALPLSKVLHRKPKKKLRHFLLESSVPFRVPDEGPVVIELTLLPDGEVRARPWPELLTGPPPQLPGPSSLQQELLELRDSDNELTQSGGVDQLLMKKVLVSRSTTEVRASMKEYLGLAGDPLGSSDTSLGLGVTRSTGSSVGLSMYPFDGRETGEGEDPVSMEEVEEMEMSWSFKNTAVSNKLAELERRALAEEFGFGPFDDIEGLDGMEGRASGELEGVTKGGLAEIDQSWREEMRTKAILEASLGAEQTKSVEKADRN